jgi:hypothetical protein
VPSRSSLPDQTDPRPPASLWVIRPRHTTLGDLPAVRSSDDHAHDDGYLVRSLAVGLSKEVMDSTAGGSGFSFVDMAANCAGIRMAAVATRNSRSAHDIQTRIRRGVEISDVLPSIRGLPEAITADQLQADYGGLSGAETKRLLGEIDRRISELLLYR